MDNILNVLDKVIYWTIILIPFSISIAPAPTNILAGILIVAFLTKKLLKKEYFFVKTPVNIPLFFFFLISCVSVIHSIDYRDSLKGGVLRLLWHILVFFCIVEELKDRDHINRIIFFIGLGVVLSTIDGIWQITTGRDFIRGYFPVVNIGLARATASFKDPNVLGIYLSAFAPVLFGLTLYYLKNKKPWLIPVSVLALTGIVLTYSRPTLLAIYVSLFFLGIAMKNKSVVITLAVLLLISPFILPKSVKDWAKEVGYNPLRFMCNDDRLAVYRNTLNMIKDHPFIGVGANTYMKNYKKYKEPREYRDVVTLDYMYAHNIYLHMAGEIGLIGLGIFLWLVYKLFHQAGSIYSFMKDPYLKTLALLFMASLMAFLVNGLTESSLYYSRVGLIFWYISALLMSLENFIHTPISHKEIQAA